MKKFRLPLYFLLLLVSCTNPTTQTEAPPNIIFIMSDDHAYQAISAYGDSLNHTPNIDRLAAEGALFTRSFVTNSICAPSRAVMLTGQHSFINGKVDNLQPFNWDQDNFAKRLRSAGYQTALIGKIHLGGTPQGFDYVNVLPGQGHYYSPDFIKNGERQRLPGYVTTVTTDLALQWLNEERKPDQPFLLLYHQKAPHRPWMPEAKYLDLYEDRTYEPPANFFDNYQDRPAAADQEMSIVEDMDLVYDLKMLDPEGELQTRYRDHFQAMYDRMDEEQRAAWDAYYLPKIKAFKAAGLSGEALARWKYDRYMKDYLRSIQSVDDGVGQLLDYLDEQGLTENTIVVYTSDQGFYLGEHGWFDKRFMYEESFRTPLLIRYPKKIQPGTVIEALVQNLDYAPTLLDYAGQAIPEEMQGLSMLPLLESYTSEWRDAVYYTYYEYPAEHQVKRHHGIRTDRYKLIHFYYDLDYWELYDLETDPSEMKNVYDDENYTAIRTEMHQRLEDLRRHYGDSDEQDQYFLQRFLESRADR